MRVGITVTISLVLLVQSTIAQQLPREESSPDSAFAKATVAVNAKLKDPQSAHYGEMVRKVGPTLNGKPAEVVCGSVTQRYGGIRSFVYFIADRATFIAEVTP